MLIRTLSLKVSIRKLIINKTVHNADIPVKILKGNPEFFAEYKTVQILNKFKLRCFRSIFLFNE